MPAPKDLPGSPAERLVTAATDLFYRRGFGAVSVEDIIEAGSVSKPTLYRRFPSKDDLGAACLERLIDTEYRAWCALAAKFKDDPVAHLSAFIAYHAERASQPQFRGSAFINAATEITEASHPGRKVVDRFEAEVRAYLVELCERAGRQRPQALADGLFLLLHGAAACRHVSTVDGPVRALNETAAILIQAHRPTDDVAA